MKQIALLLIILGVTSSVCFGQQLIKGIVVDSASFTNLQGVHIKVKNTTRVTTTNANGIFTIVASPSDTLIFSFIGYSKAVLPVHLEDETMLVRLHEESILLKELIVKDKGFHINQKYTQSPTLTNTKPLRANSTTGIGVNFSYFSKLEKEKRKLVKVMANNDQIKIYLEVVNDPDLKNEVMNRHHITEEKFYELLAVYNETHQKITSSKNAAYITSSILKFYENALSQNK